MILSQSITFIYYKGYMKFIDCNDQNELYGTINTFYIDISKNVSKNKKLLFQHHLYDCY